MNRISRDWTSTGLDPADTSNLQRLREPCAWAEDCPYPNRALPDRAEWATTGGTLIGVQWLDFSSRGLASEVGRGRELDLEGVAVR